MARKLLEDMVKIKNTEREIKIAKINDPALPLKKNNKTPKYRLYLVAVISILFLLFALSYFFSGVKITIVPNFKQLTINEKISGTGDKNSENLPFDLVVITGEENKIIPGSETTDVFQKATGAVIFYNSFSPLSQNLDINTRLEGSNGKIYKTTKKITIPGAISEAKPGSVEMEIYGSEAGEEYNSEPLDFKILGFKNTPKYSKIYARSKGPITGGIKGKALLVSDLDKISAVSELKVTLKNKLLKKSTDQIPSGYILFKDAIFLNIEDKNISYSPAEDNMMKVTVKATLYGFLFDEKKLTQKIAEKVIDKYDGSEVFMPNIRDLTFSLIDKENVSFVDVKNINFNLTGTLKIIWKVDESKLISDVLNKKKSDFNEILKKHPSIISATLVVRPFWKSYFPEENKNIEIIISYPN